MALVDHGVRVMVAAAGRRPAGMTRARAGKRDEAGDDRAEERQEDDRLIHAALSPSSG